jgi:hypothetical protein
VNRLLLPLAKFVAVTAPLTWLWLEGGRDAYHAFFIDVTRPMLVWYGWPQSQLGSVPQRFISYVPFLALMLITPRITMTRRFWGTAIGFGLLFLSHAGFVMASIVAYTHYGETPRAIKAVFGVMLLLDSFPFLLWAVICWQVIRDTIEDASEKIFGEAKSPKDGNQD